MSSPTAICNLSLGHIGVSKEIQNLTTEASAEAKACRRFYEPARDEFLRDFPYPFTTKILALGLVETDPNDEWKYSYRYPSDCDFFKKIQSGIRNESRKQRVSYRIARDNNGKLVFTDRVDAIGEWTIIVTDIAQWPMDSQMALSFLIATYITPVLAAGDPLGLGARALKLYEFSKTKAESNALNEQQDDVEPESEFISGRN